MGKKYIIELEDNESVYKTVVANGYPMIQIIVPAPYTKPDLEQVRKEAYEQGLSDAWEAARKIWQSDNHLRIFKVPMRMDCFTKFSASECIEKIRQYEQEKEERIQVGDEVIRHYKSEFAEGDDAPSIFLSEEDGYFRCLAFNGRSIMIAEYPKNQYRKTGRHFAEIAEVLQKMKKS